MEEEFPSLPGAKNKKAAKKEPEFLEEAFPSFDK
jgi:hypothetical protein